MRKLLDWIAAKLGYAPYVDSPWSPCVWLDEPAETEFAIKMAQKVAAERFELLAPYVERLGAIIGRDWDALPRTRMGGDAIARGERWESFYREEGGLADMIERLRRSYFEKVGSLKPGDHDSLVALGMADRIAREIEQQVRQVIDTGKIEASAKGHANKIAAIRR